MKWNYNKDLNYYSCLNNGLNNNDKYTLGIFNFFGTLAWSEKGELVSYNPDILVMSSPLLDIIIDNIKNKGYTVCILEIFRKTSNIESIQKTISFFIKMYKLEVSVVLVPDDKIFTINKIFKDLFKSSYRFGRKSFYCADEIDFYDSNPWYRLSENDTIISKSLGIQLYKPEDVLGSFITSNFYFLINDLVITCGQEYSGYDMLYESIEIEAEHLGMECKLKMFLNDKIYFIPVQTLLEYGKTIKIKQDIHYIIIGSNPTLEERMKIASMFQYEDANKNLSYSIAWFTRPPYQWCSSYKSYINRFSSPILTGERWFRFN